jgi:hypothetical protein
MSDMKTFTARDLNRSPAAVLAAADRDGVARVRSRNGRTYSIKPEAAPARKVDWEEFVRRRRAALKKHFPDGPIMTREQAAKFDELLAGDGVL